MKTYILRSTYVAISALFIAMFALPQHAQAQTKEAYVVKSDDGKNLTFYYDTQKATRPGTKWGIEEKHEGTSIPAWAGTSGIPNTTTTQAVIDPSFKDFRPKTTVFWFNQLQALTQITGIEHLNTSEVTNMRSMFYGCAALTRLDVSNFNTANVTDMACMFAECAALTQLDVSKFDTHNVTRMNWMFGECSALPQLDVSNFNTANVTNIGYMFSNCAVLTTIYCNKAWTCGNSAYMFIYCKKLKGAVSYDENKIDATMANPDTGYFTKKGSAGIAQTGHAATVKAVYSVDGRRLKATQPGVNIVKMSDGTTRKIVKK